MAIQCSYTYLILVVSHRKSRVFLKTICALEHGQKVTCNLLSIFCYYRDKLVSFKSLVVNWKIFSGLSSGLFFVTTVSSTLRKCLNISFTQLWILAQEGFQ
jgi:hypothetical protein